jgi:Zn-dependent protease/CBS domain-containing protein
MTSFRLARVAGIDIAIHPSWLVIFVLVTWSLATSYFPAALPTASTTTQWLLGAVAALLLFTSVLVHELAHSIVARRSGLDVQSITLFIFGGVSNLTAESPRPGVEFRVAIVGPLSSFGIAAVALAGATAAPAGSAVEAVLGYVGIINVLLGAFNLIPGFPLDGGRVLRSVIWQATGSLRRATEIAGTVGILVAYAFFIWGFLRVLNGDLLGGLWIAAIGWFLQMGANASIQQVRIDEALRGLRVGDVVRADARAVPPDLPVSRLINDYLLPLNRRAMPVVDDGRLVGVATLGDIKDTPARRRPTTRVADVMEGRAGLHVARTTDSLVSALEMMGRGDFEQLPVVDESDHLVGCLTRADIMRQFQLRAALDVSAKKPAPASGQGVARA